MSITVDTQQRIIDSARELIYFHSYAQVGVAAICKHAGVQKGSFYHFFRSKSELTLAVLEQSYLDMKQNLLDKAFDASVGPLQRIENWIEFAIEFHEMIIHTTGKILGCPFGNIALEMSTQDDRVRQKIDHIFSKLEQYVKQTLEQLKHLDEFATINTQATATAMVAYFEGVVLLAKTRNDIELLRNLLPEMRHIRVHKLA